VSVGKHAPVGESVIFAAHGWRQKSNYWASTSTDGTSTSTV